MFGLFENASSVSDGFRKMTPLDRGGLTRAESDQDHLEFSHPYFVRDRSDLLVNIKRKVRSWSVNSNCFL